MFDVAIVGAGPAGTSCGGFCAQAGLQTILLERENFPREKVCGDCLNPSCWPILQRLGLVERVRKLPHARLESVEFIGINGQSVSVALPDSDNCEIALKRSLFDHLLMLRAKELGCEIHQGSTVTGLDRRVDHEGSQIWTIRTNGDVLEARWLVAADGRNSTVARLCNLLPHFARERIALQTHIPMPVNFGNRVVLQLLPEGYSGQAPVGNGELNLCLVGRADSIRKLKKWAERKFTIHPDHAWRTITPLTRPSLPPTQPGLLLIGDAARVVEPFTGEGIFYALGAGELAARSIAKLHAGADEYRCRAEYEAAQQAMYSGRLWLNQLARIAVLFPMFGSVLLRLASQRPGILRLLTCKVVRPGSIALF
jgi:menaquinone-9 beta-reductase